MQGGIRGDTCGDGQVWSLESYAPIAIAGLSLDSAITIASHQLDSRATRVPHRATSVIERADARTHAETLTYVHA